jgi:hypothetical protein
MEERSLKAWCHFTYPSYISDGPLVGQGAIINGDDEKEKAKHLKIR